METAITILQSVTALLILKTLMVVLLLVYAVFAFLMMKQVSAMTRVISMKDDYIIRALGVLHFVFAIVVLILSLAIL